MLTGCVQWMSILGRRKMLACGGRGSVGVRIEIYIGRDHSISVPFSQYILEGRIPHMDKLVDGAPIRTKVVRKEGSLTSIHCLVGHQ